MVIDLGRVIYGWRIDMMDGSGVDAVREEALDIVAAGGDLAGARTEEAEVRAEAEGLRAGIDAAVVRTAELDASIVAMRAERDGLDARIAASSTERDELNARIVGLRTDLGPVEARLAALHDREVSDERRIEVDLGAVRAGLGDSDGRDPGSGQEPSPPPAQPPAVVSATFMFYVDGKPYETDQARMTGLQIKAKVPDWVPTHDLSLEGTGTAADRTIPDGEVIDFSAASAPLHFASVPKASFG